MYIVNTVFDDGTFNIFNTITCKTQLVTLAKLRSLCKKQSIIGVITFEDKIVDVHSCKLIKFESEYEMQDYITENNLINYNIVCNKSMYAIILESNQIIHVDYYIGYYLGNEITYLGIKDGKNFYTPYIQAASSFTRAEAGKKAAIMTKSSKTGKKWESFRVERW